jgi:hypothetical protein
MKRRAFIMLLGGAAVARPIAARAQQPTSRMPVIGFLHAGRTRRKRVSPSGIRTGLRDTGYEEGRNLAIEYHWAKGDYSRLAVMVEDPVGEPVRVLAAPTTGEMSRWQANDVVGCAVPGLRGSIASIPLRHERRSRIALEDNVSVLRDGSDNVYDRHAAG